MSVALVAIVGSVGCGGSASSPASSSDEASATETADPDTLLAQWKTLVANPENPANDMQSRMVAVQLANQAPDRLNVMVDMLTDPATKPESKLLIYSSLETVLNPELVKRLLDLTKPGVDDSVRAGVTMLLARVGNPIIDERLQELKTDEDRRVRLAALNGLMLHGDVDARNRLRDMYFEKDLPKQYKERIALTFGLSPKPDDIALLADALSSDDISDATKSTIVGAMGLLSDPACLPALQACIAGNAPEELKAFAKETANAIKARNSGGETAEGTTAAPSTGAAASQ